MCNFHPYNFRDPKNVISRKMYQLIEFLKLGPKFGRNLETNAYF